MPLPAGYQWTSKQSYRAPSYLTEPSREQRDEEKQQSEQLFSEWDWENPDKLGPQGEALPELAIGWQPNGKADFGPGFSGWLNKFKSNVTSAWNTGYEEGMQISGLTEFAIKKAQGEEEGTQTIEQMKEERKPKDENTALWTATLESSKAVFGEALWGVLDVLTIPAIATEQTIGALGRSIGDIAAGEDVNFKRNYDASRMAYSGIFDATVFAEMERRIDAGIRPDLAAQEIMIAKPNTMWPELIGQIIFDPLNFISIWGKPLGLGKAARELRITKSIQKTFATLA